MSESKYGKYIYEPKPAKVQQKIEEAKKRGTWHENYPKTPLAYIDDEYVKGAFYTEAILISRATQPGKITGPEPHVHEEFVENIGFFGTDPQDPFELNGEVEITLGDEKHTFTKSCVIYVPKGLVHCPIIFKRIDKPIFHFSVAPVLNYNRRFI
jgi:hypothetical protein